LRENRPNGMTDDSGRALPWCGLYEIQKLLALGHCIIVGVDDLNVDVEPLGGVARGSSLSLLVVVLLHHQRNNKAEFGHIHDEWCPSTSSLHGVKTSSTMRCGGFSRETGLKCAFLYYAAAPAALFWRDRRNSESYQPESGGNTTLAVPRKYRHQKVQ